MWLDYYYPNLTDTERDELKFHNGVRSFIGHSAVRCVTISTGEFYVKANEGIRPDHCLDTLRESIMCHADISLLTMRWGKTQPIPLANFSAPHECINWQSLDEWSQGRSVDVMRPGFLAHPTLGPSFPNGRGVRTGVGHDS